MTRITTLKPRKIRRFIARLCLVTATLVAFTVVTPANISSATQMRQAKVQRGHSGPMKKAVKARRSRAQSFRAEETPTKSVKAKGKKSARKKLAADAWDPSLADVFRAFVVLFALGLFLHWRRQTRETLTRQARSGGTFTPYAGTPVHLATSGVDPATLRQEHTMVPLGLNELVPSLPVLRLEEDDPRHIAAEIEALTGRKAEFKVKAEAAALAQQAQGAPLSLPGELSAHFPGIAGERLVWTTQLGSNGQLGTVAVTDRRLVAVHRQRVLKLIPPSFDVEMRRHQHPINTVGGIRSVRHREPLFLLIVPFTVTWFPLGTIVACAAIGAFLGITRSALEVTTTSVRRRYSLPLNEHENARRAFAKVRDEAAKSSDSKVAS